MRCSKSLLLREEITPLNILYSQKNKKIKNNVDIYLYFCNKIAIYHYMVTENYTTNQDFIMLLSQRLKEYRLAARISQKEMAEKSGVSLTTISHLEQGVNQNITLNNFISLLRAVGMEQRLNDLLPELPMPPMALKQINKYIPKRVRRNSHDTES